jgi:hypothetical protein
MSILFYLICCINELTEVFLHFSYLLQRQIQEKEFMNNRRMKKPTEMPRQAVRVLPVTMVCKVLGPNINPLKLAAIKCMFII